MKPILVKPRRRTWNVRAIKEQIGRDMEHWKEGEEMRVRMSTKAVDRRWRAYNKTLEAEKKNWLYTATEEDVLLLQRVRKPLSIRKIRSALEVDHYTCTVCGTMQVWMLGDRREMSNRLYRECGFSYYTRPNILLDVHHIVSVPFGDDDLNNLSILCKSCHRKITVKLCRWQAEEFDKCGSICVDKATRDRTDRIREDLGINTLPARS
jgi:hypothetical protein